MGAPSLQMTWQSNLQRRRSGQPPLGLRNLGNTCYLNSVLQCLTYTPPLANFCIRSQHSRLCEKLGGGGNGKKECPFCILEKRIARSLSLDGPHDAPSKIENRLKLFAEHFQWGRQEDAHEFLRYVIDACHNTCLKLLKATSPSSAPASAAENGGVGGGPSTVVKEIFGGALLSQVKCLSCNAESNKTDEIMDVSLDLFQSNSLRDALRRFFQPEILDGSNKYSCGSCKKLSEARKQMFVLRAPNVLVIQLKRFEGVYGAKINRDIAFEEILVLSNFMCKASQDPQPEYSLFGSVVHSGYSPESGHYYAYIKDANGSWYCCNDAYVSLSTTQEVLSEKVYILFYVRSNQKPKPVKTGLVCNGVKSPDSRRSDASLGQKPSVPLKPPATKPNGALHSDKDTPATLKNRKLSPNPQIKFGNLKNLEIKKVATNGNGNLKVRSSASNKESNNCEQSAVVEKKSALPTSRSGEQSTVTQNIKMPPNSNGNVSNGFFSSNNMVGQNSQQTSSITNGNGCNNSTKVEAHKDNDTQNVAVEGNGADCNHGHHVTFDKYTSNVSGNKRKSLDAQSADGPVSDLAGQDVSCSRDSTCDDKKSSGRLEKFKEVIAMEASSNLRSCGWYDEVRNSMHARKKLCAEAKGNHPDKAELKKLLIDDAKKTFSSKLPNSLRLHLIERLRSFSQGENLLDA